MIVGPTKVLFMDEISTGLDSSTTFSIVKSLSRFAHAMSGTVLVSLLQPAPETFALFDDVLLLSEGQVVYHGPIGNVMEFFESCGFKLPERKGIADFLQEVTSRKDQEQYWADKSRPYRFIPVREFAEAFRSFHVGVKLYEDLAVPYSKDKSHPAALAVNRYSISKLELLKICFQRERILFKRNAVVAIVKAVQITVGAFVSMTTFFRTRLHQDQVGDGVLYVNALFFAIVIFFFTGFGELAGTINRLPVLIKQRDMLLSPAWAYTISTMILSIPSSLLEVGIYSCMTYFVTGYAPDAGRFFKYYLVLFMIQQQAGGMFRFIAGLCRTDTLAFTLGWIMILLLFMLGGFIIPRPDIPVWWRWAYWATNMAYAEQATSVNELTAPRWQKPNPADPSTPLGVAVLESRGLFPYSYWYWIGIGGLIGFYILFNVAFTVSLGFMPAIGKPQPIMSEQELAEKEAARSGIPLPKSASQSRS
ncbi:hypothetical protein M758_10G188300 [Ceratodon purpureus]|nr:hypothetical protein KC19_10G192700 [Ceratodon purpureus]KAG0560613.1 hypothetical protein KC19_10G193200 [Ceratodon purpureus]KAG0604683.1 hypothetical protein M758_10G188300 [Ceratodon purpureus]